MAPRIIDNHLYYHYSVLKNWYKNEETRLETESNWEKSLEDIAEDGILVPFVIDQDNTVYDGNGRLLAVTNLIKQGKTQAKNGKELEWIPVMVYPVPQTEEEKWKLALKSNNRFRSWNKETIFNYQDEWKDLNLSAINLDFGDPITLEEKVALPDKFPEIDTSLPEETGDKEHAVVCPNCNHSFTVDTDTKNK